MVTLHTSCSHRNQKNCLYIADRVSFWHMLHPASECSKPPPLRDLAMPGRECRAVFHTAATWVQRAGTLASGAPGGARLC